MNDEKRFLRELKRTIKKAGNRKRRRYLKDVTAEAEDFSLGRDRTDVMNEKPRQAKSRQPRPAHQPSADDASASDAGRPATGGLS
jgi:hypothetical protein